MRIELYTKYRTLSVEKRAAFWFMFCSLLQNAAAVLTTPIFTRLLSTEQYGIVSKFTSWVSLFTILVSFNVDSGVFFNLMLKGDDRSSRQKIVGKLFGLIIFIATIYLIFGYVIKNIVKKSMGTSFFLYILILGDAFLVAIMALWNAYHRYEYDYKKVVILLSCKTFLNPILSLLLIYGMSDNAMARVYGIIFTDIVIGLFLVFYFYIPSKSLHDIKVWKYAVSFNLSLLPYFISSAVLNQGDRIMISMLAGDSEAGIYSLGYAVGSMSSIFTSSLLASWTPYMFKKLKADKKADFHENLLVLCGIMFIICSVMMMVVPEMVYLFAPAKYVEAVGIVPPVIMGNVFVFVYGNFANVECFYGKNIYMSIASIVAAVLNIFLNYIFIPMIGYKAAAYTTLVCYIAMAYFHAFFVYVIVGEKNINKIIQIRFLFFICIGAIMITIGINYLYQYTLLRYFVFLCLTIASLYIYRKYPFLIKKIFTGKME